MADTSESVVLWEQRGTTALVTLNRPKALNALNAELIDTLTALLAAKGHDPSLRAIVLTGSGKAFVAGADIAAMQDMTPAQAEAFSAKSATLAQVLGALPVPVIAAVNGFALGGGCELAMCCDIILAGPKATFGQPEVNLAVIPGFGGTQRLVRRVGVSAAMDLCLTGRMIKAQEAVTIGLASRAIDGDVVEAALEVAAEIAKKGPFAIRMARRAINENADSSLEAGLAAERTLFAMCFSTADQKEGMAAFLERRPPQFTGR